MNKRTTNVDPFEIIQSIDEPLCVLNESYAIVFGNRAFDDSFGVSRVEIEGNSVFEIGNRMFDLPIFREKLSTVLSGAKKIEEFDIDQIFPKIGQKIFTTRCGLMRRYGPTSEKQVLIRFEDITERMISQKALRQKTQEILELSTPITKIWDEILVLPLIGTLDPNRANKMIEQLLEAIRRENARNIIMDGTGLNVIDNTVATTILKATSAIKLLGSQVIMTGIKPEVAMTMVQLGIDLRDIVTRASLQEGVQYALDSRGYMILQKSTIQEERSSPMQQNQNQKPTMRIINPYREP